jgi:hypothetical protein
VIFGIGNDLVASSINNLKAGGKPMATATLCIIERQRAGVRRDDLAKISGATEVLIRGPAGIAAVHPLNMRASYYPPASVPETGKADLRLKVGDDELDLAKFEGAVALVIQHGRSSVTVCWIDDGQCSGVQQRPIAGLAFSEVEAKHRAP